MGAGVSTSTITGGGNFPFLTSPGGIEVLSGTLDLACDGTATGTLPASFTVAAGCTLQFDGDFTLGAGAGIGGPGIVEVPQRRFAGHFRCGFVRLRRHHDHRRWHDRIRRQCAPPAP